MAALNLDSAEQLFADAFRLAHFVHAERSVALKIASSALAKLEVAATAQDKRLYYRPRNSPRGKRDDFRTKVSLTERQLLQRLVYIESEPYEKETERREGGVPGVELMLIRFVKHLVQITLKRNSFYVTLGFCRILENYTTAETMAMSDVLIADATQQKDDYYYRSRKRRLFSELKERFGDALTVVKGPRGEDRFLTQPRSKGLADLVIAALEQFVPWGSSCLSWNDGSERLEEMAGMRDHASEVMRIHAILHWPCLERLSRLVGLDPPERRLEVPQFAMAGHSSGPSPRPAATPALQPEELLYSAEARRRDSDQRRRARPTFLRIFVDGTERGQLDLSRQCRTRLELAPEAELVEVRAGRVGLLLATLLLDDQMRRGGETQITLEGGQRLTFCLSPSDLNQLEPHCSLDVDYIETRALRSVLLWLWRMMLAPIRATRRPWLQAIPAFAAAALVAIAAWSLWPKNRDTGEWKATRSVQSLKPGATLSSTRKLLVNVTGPPSVAQSLQHAVAHSLNASGRFELVDRPELADAALKVRVEGTAARARADMQLVNVNGDILWPTSRSSASFRGSPEQIGQAAAEELLAQIRHTESKP